MLTSEEVEIVIREGKEYWACPYCDFETPILDWVAAVKRRMKAYVTKRTPRTGRRVKEPNQVERPRRYSL